MTSCMVSPRRNGHSALPIPSALRRRYCSCRSHWADYGSNALPNSNLVLSPKDLNPWISSCLRYKRPPPLTRVYGLSTQTPFQQKGRLKSPDPCNIRWAAVLSLFRRLILPYPTLPAAPTWGAFCTNLSDALPVPAPWDSAGNHAQSESA